MKITIEANPNEIAALILAVQERQVDSNSSEKGKKITLSHDPMNPKRHKDMRLFEQIVKQGDRLNPR